MVLALDGKGVYVCMGGCIRDRGAEREREKRGNAGTAKSSVKKSPHLRKASQCVSCDAVG